MLFVILSTGCAGSPSSKPKAANQEVPALQNQTVHFDFGKKSVRDNDFDILKAVALHLQQEKKAVAILEGHADPSGSAIYNEILAEDRARAVRVYLRDQGADPARTTVVSKGSREPAVKGASQAALAADRRVEIILTLLRD